jgi:hypothetical protein
MRMKTNPKTLDLSMYLVPIQSETAQLGAGKTSLEGKPHEWYARYDIGTLETFEKSRAGCPLTVTLTVLEP